MDLPGAEWPYHLQGVVTLLGLVVLCASAWRWAGRRRSAPARYPGLLGWWVAAVGLMLTRDPFLVQVAQLGLALPGSDWEYVPPPTSPGKIVLFVLVGGVYNAALFGTLLGAVVATARTLRRAQRERTSTPERDTAEP